MNEDLIYYPDYEPNPDVDDDKMLHIKEAVNELDTLSKIVFLTYCELGSYAALGRQYGVSSVTAKKYIEKIRTKIYNNL